MISILTCEADQLVVREFFELFKTPWQFHTAGAPAEILLCAGVEVPDNDAALTIVYGSGLLEFDRRTGISGVTQTEPGWLRREGVELPVYGRWLVEAGSENGLFQRGQINGRPFVRVGLDLFAEVRHLLTTGQPPAQAAVPALERHIAFLRDLILSHGRPLVEIPPRPAGYEYIACLTHDVDHPGIRYHTFDHTLLGFLYRATAGTVRDVCRGRKTLRQLAQNLGAVLRLPLVRLGLARDFWREFEHYTALEGGRPSTFFVIPEKGVPGLDTQGRRAGRRAASYDAVDLQADLKRLQLAGREIGVHGLEAWRDATAGAAEKKKISGLVAGGATGIRMHWLYFDAGAPARLEAAGYDYDSTVGYNGTVGYRAGTGQVYKPLTTQRLLELPLQVMDTALFYPSYLNLSPGEAEAVVRPFLENAVRFGGTLTVNWHDRSLAPERLWGGGYVRLLEQMQAGRPWFATASQAVAWFRLRRSATFESSPTGGGVRIKLPAPGDDGLPPLRVRVFEAGRTGGQFSERTIQAGQETSIAA